MRRNVKNRKQSISYGQSLEFYKEVRIRGVYELE
jgi:hypothetical protein